MKKTLILIAMVALLISPLAAQESSNARGVAGTASLTAVELSTGKQASTQVGCSPTGYDIHYRGLTTHHPY